MCIWLFQSLSNAAMYCVSSMSLWKETPGAIDWATKNANTFICASLLNGLCLWSPALNYTFKNVIDLSMLN